MAERQEKRFKEYGTERKQKYRRRRTNIILFICDSTSTVCAFLFCYSAGRLHFYCLYKNFAARLYSKRVGVHLYVWCFQYALYCDFLSICFPKYGSKLNKLYLCVSKKGECVAWQTTHSTCAL